MGLAETVVGVALKDRAANEKLFAHRFHVRVKVECTQCLFERVKPFYLMVDAEALVRCYSMTQGSQVGYTLQRRTNRPRPRWSCCHQLAA